MKRRIEENDREEKRRVEYAQFLEVASQHKKLLELTVYNCDLAIRCTGLIEELVAEGCSAVKARFDKTNQELSELRIRVHKEHLEYFRMLYLTLGSLIYKKEKRLEEIDRTIRSTHIQLEFCIETFDPNAKKHSDQKKELYVLRHAVEEELGLLKEKQAKAMDDFKESEEALDAVGHDFHHPVDENNEEVLSRRTKMVEYKVCKREKNGRVIWGTVNCFVWFWFHPFCDFGLNILQIWPTPSQRKACACGRSLQGPLSFPAM